MASNLRASSISPSFESGSASDDHIKPITLFGAPIVVNGSNDDHLSIANTVSNNQLSHPKLTSTLSTSISSNPAKRTYGELDVCPYKQNEQMQPPHALVAHGKRPRGRPIGSKNKPKPTIESLIPTTPVSRERENFPEPIVLIVPTGMDIVNAIKNFGREKDVNILVHHASGYISDVIISNPFSPSNGMTFSGKFHMSYLLGFYTNDFSPSTLKNIPYSSFTIQFSRVGSPQLFGGLVGAKLIVAEPVRVLASITKKREYTEVEHFVMNPNVEPIINTQANHYTAIMNTNLNGISNNIPYHPSFLMGASSSFPTNVQPSTAPFGPIDTSIPSQNNPIE